PSSDRRADPLRADARTAIPLRPPRAVGILDVAVRHAPECVRARCTRWPLPRVSSPPCPSGSEPGGGRAWCWRWGRWGGSRAWCPTAAGLVRGLREGHIVEGAVPEVRE